MQIAAQRGLQPLPYLLPITWVVLIATASLWGNELVAHEPRIRLASPPLFARFEPQISLWVAPALILAAFALVYLPPAVSKLRWSRVVWLIGLVAIVWPAALALTDGPSGITRGLESSHDYLDAVPRVDSLATLGASFVDEIARFPIHVQGHPPGFLTLLTLVDRAGLGGSGWAAALVLFGAALAPVAVLVVIRDVMDEAAARRAAPFLVLAPAAIWIGTSADAFFAGIGAAAVAAAVVASSRDGRRRIAVSASAGTLGAMALLLSYGLVLLAVVALPLLVARRAWDVIAVSAVTTVVLLILTAAVSGFNIVEGLAATQERYLAGVSQHRPFSFFLVANLAAFALALGPAVFAPTRGIPSRLGPLALGALAAVALADLSGFSKGEVERIWLPFAPWLLWVAAFAERWSLRTRLTLQVAVGLGLELIVVTPW